VTRVLRFIRLRQKKPENIGVKSQEFRDNLFISEKDSQNVSAHDEKLPYFTVVKLAKIYIEKELYYQYGAWNSYSCIASSIQYGCGKRLRRT